MKIKIILKPLLFLLLSMLMIFVHTHCFKTEKIIKGTVIQSENIDGSPTSLKRQSVLLEIPPKGDTLEIVIIHENRIFIGQIIEVQGDGKEYKVLRVIK